MGDKVDYEAIPNYRIPKVRLEDEFDVVQTVGEGWFAKVFLAEHRKSRSELVLKALPKHVNSAAREFHISYNLSRISKILVKTYDVFFEADGCYVFAQEYAPFGDLGSNMGETGIGDINGRRVAKQVAQGLDFLHQQGLVHRDLQPHNILIFKSDFSKVKLADFGETRKIGTLVARFNEWLPYCPPEIVSTPQEQSYPVHIAHDAWQFGILILTALTGRVPWQKAEARSDPGYDAFTVWIRSRIVKTPSIFKPLSSKARKLVRKLLEPNPTKRTRVSLTEEVNKAGEEKWIVKAVVALGDGEESLATDMSAISFHSCVQDKERLLGALSKCGVETVVDRKLKRERLNGWIAAIEEEQDPESGSED